VGIFTNEFTAVGSSPVSSQAALLRVQGAVAMVYAAGVCFDENRRLHFIPD